MPSSVLTASTVTSDSADWAFTGGSDGSVLNSDDADTSFAFCNDNAAIERYALSDLPAAAALVSAVDITTWKARRSDVTNRNMRVGLYLGGSTTMGTTQTVSSTPGYTMYNDTGLARPGGGIWTPAAVNSTELVVETTATVANSAARITYVVTTVTWTSTGGLIFLLLQWLGPLVAVGLHEMPALAAELRLRSRTLLLPNELHGAWREMAEYRHRVTVA